MLSYEERTRPRSIWTNVLLHSFARAALLDAGVMVRRRGSLQSVGLEEDTDLSPPSVE